MLRYIPIIRYYRFIQTKYDQIALQPCYPAEKYYVTHMISGQSYNIAIRFLNESIVEKKNGVFKCFQGR